MLRVEMENSHNGKSDFKSRENKKSWKKSPLSEIERQLVKAPLAAAISPVLISLTHPTYA